MAKQKLAFCLDEFSKFRFGFGYPQPKKNKEPKNNTKTAIQNGTGSHVVVSQIYQLIF